MTPEHGAEWVAFATRRTVDDVRAVLSDDQLVVMGEWLSQNRLLNPPKPKPKVGEFICQCGCGEAFTAEWTTSRPKFKNAAHRMRWWRAKYKEGR